MTTLIRPARNVHQNAEALAVFRERIDSLQAFHLAANSFAGRGGYRSSFMVTTDRVAHAVTELGRLMMRGRLVEVTLEIIRGMNPHAASKDWQAGLFRSAAAALGKPHIDVERATGPESCRWSDVTTSYTLAEKLLVYETVRSLCDDWIGPGWASTDLAAELGVLLPQRRS